MRAEARRQFIGRYSKLEEVDGVIKISYTTTQLSHEDMASVITEFHTFTLNLPPTKLLVDLSNLIQVDESILFHMATSKEINRNVCAVALLLTNEINELLVSVFAQYKPFYPTQAFYISDEQKAIHWLNSQ